MSGREPAWDGGWVQKAVERYEDPLALYATRLVGDPVRAQDVVQHTFLQLCKQDRSAVEDHLAEWLYTVCRNEALSVLRKEKRASRLPQGETGAQEDGGPSPLEVLELKESQSQVLGILGTLPGNQQEAIRLKYQQGLTYSEIARVLGTSRSNAGVLIYRGLRKINEEFKRQFHEAEP